MTEEEKRALLNGARGEVFDRALGEAQRDREAATLRRERDEARAQVKAWQDEELSRRRERDEARRELERLTQERDDLHALSLHSCSASCQRPACVMRRERDEARAEVERLRSEYECAECQHMRRERDDARVEVDRLRAVLRESNAEVLTYGAEADEQIRLRDEQIRLRDEARAQLAALRAEVHGVLSEPHAYIGGRERSVLTCALGAAAATAEAHDRRVRAEALREAADAADWEDRTMGSGEDQTAAWLRARADEIEDGR